MRMAGMALLRWDGDAVSREVRAAEVHPRRLRAVILHEAAAARVPHRAKSLPEPAELPRMLCGLVAPNIDGLRKVADALVTFGVL